MKSRAFYLPRVVGARQGAQLCRRQATPAMVSETIASNRNDISGIVGPSVSSLATGLP